MANNATRFFAEPGKVVIQHEVVVGTWYLTSTEARVIAQTFVKLAAEAERLERARMN